ncbi:PREDICTED: F-box/LRR-repeat protein 2-like [Camelina sativa]|uniref:F-box/LRR-repeat protein 2-like n=1 Tax=Camelina sativa TaxID=90675 RepID=A0ABM0VDN6_CAMSA|nr:PREDICTED: F-box/LRR-repeat protein 2-like [Camelina sativa]
MSSVCVNEALTDDELRWVLSRLDSEKDKELFGLVCKRWLNLQSTDRKKLAARAGPHMLRRLASRFTQIVELDLSQSISRSFYPGVTDSDLAVISDGFKCLRVLNLHNCKGITDTGLASIGRCLSLLQFLDVSYCRKLSDKGLSAVAEGCHDLRALHLAGCRFITDESLKSLSERCRDLEALGLQGCANITDSGLSDLVKGCRKIKSLDINKCSNVGDAGVSSMAKACASSLKTLKLLDCYKVGNESILSLAQSCKNLETLIIGGCRDISDESIMLLAESCKDSLKNLRMDWCLNISDSSLSCILKKCKNLEALDIGCCEEITDVAFRDLGSDDVLGLKVLKVSNCTKITVTGISKLLEKCSSLEYLDVRSLPQVTEVRCSEAGLEFPNCCKVNFSGSLTEPEFLL